MFNTDSYRSIWTNGIKPCIFFLPSGSSGGQNEDECDVMRFDSCIAAIKAFDEIISGMNKGAKTMTFVETEKHLYVRYDAVLETETCKGRDGCVIKDPRNWNTLDNAGLFDKVIDIHESPNVKTPQMIIISGNAKHKN